MVTMRAKRKKQIKFVFIILTAISLSIFASDRIKTLIEKFGVSHKECKFAIFKLHRMGKDAIPFLIEAINAEKKIGNIMTNPMSSLLTEDIARVYPGVMAAYVIELIVARECLNTKEFFENEFTLGGGNFENYIYYYGIILKGKRVRIDQISERERIDPNDVAEIQRIYRFWWEKNRQKPLEQLRIEWESGKRPRAIVNSCGREK